MSFTVQPMKEFKRVGTAVKIKTSCLTTFPDHRDVMKLTVLEMKDHYFPYILLIHIQALDVM